ncbi:MAG TPA: PEP-CTERM sorting domain-containing protein [Chthoniobacteraceae bacterium]|nr:PEP-CTERM sorting domain-containing protein [Chthoniobacteraceae bacterium]
MNTPLQNLLPSSLSTRNLLLGLALVLLSGSPLRAADREWNGDGTAGRFDSPGNYSGSGSLSADTLIFNIAKDVDQLINQSTDGFNFHSITIGAGATGFHLSGMDIVFKGKIEVAANTEATFSNQIIAYNDTTNYPTRDLIVGENGTLVLDGYYGFGFTPVYKKGAGTLVINLGNKERGQAPPNNRIEAVHHFDEGRVVLGNNAILQRNEGSNPTLPVFLGTTSTTATLSGGGSIRGSVTTAGVDRSIIEVGGGDGTLQITTINAAEGLTLDFNLGLGVHLLSGDSFTAGEVAFRFSGGEEETTYTLLNYASYSVDLENFTVTTPGYLLDATFGNGGWEMDGNDLRVRFAAIPEPGTIALLSVGALFLLVRRGRNRRFF